MESWWQRWNIKINAGKAQAIYFSGRLRPVDAHVTLNGRNISFANHVRYLGVMFDRNITWRINTETSETKAFRTFVRVLSLFKSERLNAKIELALHKALIRYIMIYACPAWEFAADTQFFKLQRLQNKVLRTIDHFPRGTSVRYLHVAFKIPYVYDFITKLCRQRAEVCKTIEIKLFAT
jgi:hypothetical protein